MARIIQLEYRTAAIRTTRGIRVRASRAGSAIQIASSILSQPGRGKISVCAVRGRAKAVKDGIGKTRGRVGGRSLGSFRCRTARVGRTTQWVADVILRASLHGESEEQQKRNQF